MELKFGFTVDQVIQEGRVKKEDIDKLKSWLTTKDIAEITDEQIAIALLFSGNDTEAAKTAITASVDLAISAPELTTNRILEREDLQQHLKLVQVFVGPKLTDDGYAIIFCRLQDLDYKNFNMESVLMLFTMNMDATFYDYPPKGIILLNDVKGATLMHVMKFRMRLMKLFIKFMQSVFSVQIKQVHMINSVFFIDKFMMLFSPFFTKRMLDMIHIHSSNTDMEKFSNTWIPKSCLPQGYGGDLPSCSVINQRNIEKLQRMTPYFEALELQRRQLLSNMSTKNSN